MEKNITTVELRKQLQEAIKRCDFLKAKNIDLQIKRLEETSKAVEKTQSKRIILKKFDIAKEEASKEAMEILTKAINQLSEKRETYQNKLTQLEETYSTKLTDLKNEYLHQYEISTSRSVPEAIVLTKEAQAMAKCQDYDQAAELFTLSQELIEKTTEIRQDEVTAKFALLENQIQEEKNAERAAARETLLKGLRAVKRHFDIEIQRIQKNLTANAIKLSISPIPEEEKWPLLIITELEEPENPPNSSLLRSPRVRSSISRASSRISSASPQSSVKNNQGTPRKKLSYTSSG